VQLLLVFFGDRLDHMQKREPGTELWSDEDREMLKAMGIKA